MENRLPCVAALLAANAAQIETPLGTPLALSEQKGFAAVTCVLKAQTFQRPALFLAVLAQSEPAVRELLAYRADPDGTGAREAAVRLNHRGILDLLQESD